MGVDYLCRVLPNVISSCWTSSLFFHISSTLSHHPLPRWFPHWLVALKVEFKKIRYLRWNSLISQPSQDAWQPIAFLKGRAIHNRVSNIGLGIGVMLGSACDWGPVCGLSVYAPASYPHLTVLFHKMDMDVDYLCHGISNVLSSCLTFFLSCHSSHTWTHHPVPWWYPHWSVALKGKDQGLNTTSWKLGDLAV